MRSEFTLIVSIPSRGSGLGKSTHRYDASCSNNRVSIPSRGSGLGKSISGFTSEKIAEERVSIPSRGSGLGKLVLAAGSIDGIMILIPSRGSGLGN